jgi:Cytochrome c554 and c-prime
MKKLILMIICFVFVFSLTYSADPQYIGAKKCKMCHKSKKKGDIWQKWMDSKHAHAMDTLRKEKEDKNPECVQCHVVAFNKGGYKIGDPNNAKFEGVQCENCHGPGSLYKKMSIMKDRKKSMENGLIIPDEKTCLECHNKKSPKFKGWNYKEYLKKIDHKYTK